MKRLLLFDIDGTLLRCGRQVRRIFATALEEVYGATGDLESYDFSGKIDPQIVFELLEPLGFATDRILGHLAEMEERYLTRLEQELDAAEMTLLPGVQTALTRLSSDPSQALGLLTGNWQRGAYTKLGRLGLDSYFGSGAFGGDAASRPGLLPVALERTLERTGHRFGPEETVIIGDSVHDVTCGLAHGVPVLGVATGWTPATRLSSAGATWVAASLEEGLDLLDPP